MKQSLQLKLGQSLTITPQLQQAIKLLQLSALDLETEIKDALESNSMLERVEDKEQDQKNEELANNFKYEDYILRNSSNKSASEDIEFDKFCSKESTLQDYLLWQLNLTPCNETDKIIAENIIDSINDDGYLETDTITLFESISNQNPEIEELTIAEIEVVVKRIQQFDPIGVASRNLKECLQIQLNILPKNTPFLDTAREIVNNHLNLLGQRNYTRIKSRLKLNDEQLKAVIGLLTSLNPRPGTIISSSSSEILIPDVIVTKRQDKYTVELNRENLPKLRVNPSYAALVKRADNSRDNKFLAEQLVEAKWFIKSLTNRNDTLLKVAGCIVDCQHEFLEFGEKAMKPMILQDIAKKLELHESTVSRITSNKYIHTPRGIYELKFFFSSHINTSEGTEKSSTAIKALIREYISKEESKSPLSDCKIAKMLESEGVNVARRTVAKYREAMAIPPSSHRKKVY